MKHVATLGLALAGASLLAAAPAGAQDCAWSRGRRIDAHERVQIHRIRDGWRDGKLTRREGARLLAEQGAIRAEERLYRRTGGGLSRREAYDLRRELRRSSRDIYRQKHDDQTRDG